MKSAAVFLMLLAACSSCAGRHYPKPAPTLMDVAVVKLISIDDEGVEQGACTAWKLDENRMVTAGHCCVYEVPKEGQDQMLVLLGVADTEEKRVPMFRMEGPHSLPGATATVVFDDQENDVCVLKGKMRGAPLALAPFDPPVGDRVFTAGYPRTTFLISEGIWSGRDEAGRGIASTAIWGGASGSPLMDTDGRVVGILTKYRPPFDNLSIITPLEWVKVAAEVSKKLLK